MKKLPIGIQDFRTLIEGGNLYIDKTESIHRLISSGKYYFLSRPRRFGKSLTLSTIKEIYQGSRDLFEGLWIADQWDWDKVHRVIHFSFSKLDYQGKGLEQALIDLLGAEALKHGVELEEETIKSRFSELLQKLSAQSKVVLLIDEYDKPLIDYLEDLDKAKAHQLILKTFYSIIKDADPHIEFLLITGVSKFSKVSVFSDLNNLEDITIDWRFASMYGYTQTELEHYFEDYLKLVQQHTKKEKSQLLEKIKYWYNGYSWSPDQYVYNPFSILNFFNKATFSNFWFSSGTPTFLVNLLRDRLFFDFENIQVGDAIFQSYSLDNLETVSLLFQTGYLTIKGIDDFGIYTLDYPNREVKDSMLQHLIAGFRYGSNTESSPLVIQLRHAFYENNLDKVISIINTLFKTIPSQIFLAKKEAFYHAIIHLVFTYLGQYIESEVNTSDGRIDAVVQTPSHIYIIEFKLDKSAQEAIAQIKEKGYADRFQNAKKAIVLLGINFSGENKAVAD